MVAPFCIVISRAYHNRQTLGVDISYTACRVFKRELNWQLESGWNILGMKEGMMGEMAILIGYQNGVR